MAVKAFPLPLGEGQGEGAFGADGVPSPALRATSPTGRGDLGWFAGASLALVVLCGLPYVLSALWGPSNLERIGTFWFMRDFSQYEAAMREGASQSGWLIHDHFSAEPHAPALMYPLYVAAGKTAALLGVSFISVFQALEWVGRFAILASVYAFAATFVTESRHRRLAVLLALGTLGLDTLSALIRGAFVALGLNSLANLLPDTINPYLEVSSFGALLSAPHLMFGLALTLLCAPIYLRAIEGQRGLVWAALLGGVVALLSLVHSFNTPVLVSVLVLHAALTGPRAWPAGLIAGLAAAPMAINSLLLYQSDPFWSGTYSAQNLMPSPAPWSLPLDFGLVLLAAPLAWRRVRDWPIERQRLILLWVGLGLVWMYAPVPYQRRFAFGTQPALAVLAAVGLFELQRFMRSRGIRGWSRRLVNYSLIVAGLSTSILVYFAMLGSSLTNKPAEVYLWTRSEAAAADWLSAHSDASDVVLASTEFANPLAGVIDGRVVHGHIVATLHSDAKAAIVHEFYATDTSTADRSRLLRASGATLVAIGPSERALGASSLDNQRDLSLIYDQAGVQIYRVV